jgi:hypothetical protein
VSELSEDKRVATDILLSIESKLETVDKRHQNSENLLKLILAKLNKSPTSISSPPPTYQTTQETYQTDIINKDNFESRPRTNKFSEIAASQGVRLDDGEMFVSKSADGTKEMTESSVRGSSRGQRGKKPIKVDKTSVTQVLNIGNDPLFLASIEVLDISGDELISQTRTNTKGRWLAALAPGDYQVHVLKRFPPESGKKPIDTMYQISVPQTDEPFELDPLLLNESG